ncbi:MAG: hypothetical protein QOF22_1819 [Bradyrhizobium sp.]|nr:hypothetical protein [Bradyrhizobium sp.]
MRIFERIVTMVKGYLSIRIQVILIYLRIVPAHSG